METVPSHVLTELKLLDHGYLKFIEGWGSDESIIRAARMSTDKGFQGWGFKCRTCGDSFEGPDATDRDCPKPTPGKPLVDVGRGGHVFDVQGDEKLLAYLWNMKHATPFEMAGMTIEVQAPILVFREWHRHRTQSFSELSARYTPLPDLNYIPSIERLMLGSDGKNKQAGTIKDAEVLTEEGARGFRLALESVYKEDQKIYDEALRIGVPKELARVHLPVGRYSRMRASANLRNWLAFLTLRMDNAAQYEIRQYANGVGSFIAHKFPHTWELFAKGR